MVVQTQYGLCQNVDLEHLKEYAGEGSYMFSDYIVDNGDKGYLLFGFEVWEDDNNSFHFFVEEGFEDGSAETYKTEISKADQEEIKKIYYEYIKRR